MSIKLLIADDEAIETRALTMQLQKAFPDIAILKPANNGLELMEAARQQQPDIIIADIEMPGMNGLRALEQIQAEGMRPQIIIMTAYSSEHYLKESISLRVFEYLEKPIRRRHVEQVVAKALAEVEKDQLHNAEMVHMRDSLAVLQDVIKAQLMMTIESDEANAFQTAQYLDMLNDRASRYTVMTICFEAGKMRTESELSRNVYELRSFENLRVHLTARGWICGHVVNHRLSCLVPVLFETQNDNDYRLRQWACHEADDVLKLVDETQNLRIGIGSSSSQAEKLQISRQQSIKALYSQDRSAQICHYEDQPLQYGAGNPFAMEQTALTEALQNGSLTQAEIQIQRSFAAAPSWIDLKRIRNAVFDTLLQMKRSCHLAVGDDWTFDISEMLHRCETKEEVQSCFVRICRDCIEHGRETDKRWQEDVITQAKQYIDVHYNTDISLDGVAEAVGVSRFYLSRLFKSRLGMNYQTYLTEQRIRIAAALIQKHKKLSNSEIAERVGFRDADYFGKVFKKLIGCTVSEYRNKQN